MPNQSRDTPPHDRAPSKDLVHCIACAMQVLPSLARAMAWEGDIWYDLAVR